MECSKECNTCQTACGKSCPVCQKNGILVPNDTVIALTNSLNIMMNQKHYICVNPICDVVYFSEDDRVIKKEEVKVDVWFKKHNKNYIVCYCRNITLQDIMHSVIKDNIETKDEIIKHLNKENVKTNCLINNPLGKDCDRLFENAIENAKNIKNKQEEQKDVI